MASYFKHVIGYGICRLAPHMALASGAVQQPASSWGVFLPTSCTPRPASSISASPAFTCTCSPLTLSTINRVTLRILLVNSKSQHHVLLMSNISNSKLKKNHVKARCKDFRYYLFRVDILYLRADLAQVVFKSVLH